MTSNITLAQFYSSALGQYALRWERAQYDALVADCFGYHAVQIGASGIDFLSDNRIPLKVIGERSLRPLTQLEDSRVRIQLSYSELPFESESLDLVLLPHALEMAEDPHALLREVSRVLIPGGRVVLTGFNLTSLWGIRFHLQKFGAKVFLPGKQFMSVFQLKDWLSLLSFHVDRGTFGRYSWSFSPESHKDSSWLEKAGDRWWPQCGATDGASKGNPGPGGWGAWLKYGRHERKLCGGSLNTTNNQMELIAPINALNTLTEPCSVKLHTDSKYVKEGMTAWIYGWKKKNWKTQGGTPVKNADLWKKLDEAASRQGVEEVLKRNR